LQDNRALLKALVVPIRDKTVNNYGEVENDPFRVTKIEATSSWAKNQQNLQAMTQLFLDIIIGSQDELPV